MFAIIDTETTGGIPSRDRVMEIAIFVHDGKKVVEQFTSLVNPRVDIMPFVSSFTGITSDMLAGAPSFEEIAGKVLELTNGKIFVAHNASFDYDIIRREFKRIGVRFQRQHLCTIKLSKKLLPGIASYSLGNLCRQINIPIDNRHRAFGDAEATVRLLEHLLLNHDRELIHSVLDEELKQSILPPNISPELVDDLTEETGVFQLLDHKGRILYAGSAKNIRRKVIGFFGKEMEDPKFRELKDSVFDISCELTGTELIASLLEVETIQQWSPPFNIFLRNKKYRFGIFTEASEDGYLRLKVDNIRHDIEPLFRLSNKKSAERLMNKLVSTYNLIPVECTGTRANNYLTGISPEEYNERIRSVTNQHHYTHPSFFIIGEGRMESELSVVAVEHNRYIGFGFADASEGFHHPEQVKEIIRTCNDTPLTHRILKSWLRKKHREKVIYF